MLRVSAQSDYLIEQLVGQWSTIRRLLPPTFSGKYDKEQFRMFLQGNLNMLGFGALCIGMLMTLQVRSGVVLAAWSLELIAETFIVVITSLPCSGMRLW